jgi:hypothetical protein
MEIEATELAMYGWARGTKWANLVNLSTTTRIQLALADLGSPLIKSIEIVSQASEGRARAY